MLAGAGARTIDVAVPEVTTPTAATAAAVISVIIRTVKAVPGVREALLSGVPCTAVCIAVTATLTLPCTTTTMTMTMMTTKAVITVIEVATVVVPIAGASHLKIPIVFLLPWMAVVPRIIRYGVVPPIGVGDPVGEINRSTAAAVLPIVAVEVEDPVWNWVRHNPVWSVRWICNSKSNSKKKNIGKKRLEKSGKPGKRND